jgi:Ser/Thr protein kinase RdoA (MazF antagonist)
MEVNCMKEVLGRHYNLNIKSIELLREGGNLSYVVYTEDNRYFLKIIRPPFIENTLCAIDIQLYLIKNAFPVIPIVLTKQETAYVETKINDERKIFILYEYIEGTEPDPEDTEETGALIGRLHKVMQNYTGELPVKDKHFFIDRYVEIMRKKKYDKAEAFQAYGNEVWERVKTLPGGYCHCDLYRGNIHKDSAGNLRVMDFDTSCYAFPMYDIALFCNDTHWFNFEYDGYKKSKARLDQFLKGYLKQNTLSKEENAAFFDLIAVYHFQLQATMMEIHGYDCVDENYFDKQYEWLIKWKEQCATINNTEE